MGLNFHDFAQNSLRIRFHGMNSFVIRELMTILLTVMHVHNTVVFYQTSWFSCVLVLFTLLHIHIVIHPQVFVNKKFVDLHLITKILSHGDLELYSK